MLRKRLRVLAAIWLCGQVGAFAAAPVVFGASVHSAAVAEDGTCDCPGTAPGQACPMHESKAAAQNAADPGECILTNPCAPSDAALLALAGSPTVLPPSSMPAIDLVTAGIDRLVLNPIARAERPDAPPPRG